MSRSPLEPTDRIGRPRSQELAGQDGVVQRLLLWDIDGTLIRGGGVGSDAINQAAAAVLGRPITGEPVMMHGKTDPQILTEIFAAAEVAQHVIAELLPAAVAEAERLMAQAEVELRARGEVIGGVREVLARAASVPGVRQTLLTGNLVGNAAVKLAAFDLTRYFDVEVGAYGSDHADRTELVPIALERVAKLRGERYDAGDVWVIGDTPGDLACARAAGVRCLLVATGGIPMVELAALDADVVLADLTDTDPVVEILTR
jgi:phosphoglycolate phosphatase